MLNVATVTRGGKSNSETSFEALLSDTKTEQLLSFSSRSKSMQRRNIL